MGKIRKIIFPFLFMLAFAYTAHGSTPPLNEEEEPAVYTDTQLKERVEGARQRAIDFFSPSYFPSDWEDIDSQYHDALNTSISDESDREQVTELLYNIANAFDEIFKKTIPLYALAWEDDIMAARETLINTGLRSSYPEYLVKADNIAISALEQYEAEDYYTARETAALALAEYEILYLGARLVLRRQEIINRDFVRYNYEDFSLADEAACAALDKYETGDKEGAVESAEEALSHYNLFISNSWITYAAERREITAAERENALSNKVNIAVRDLFREAEAFFSLAEENYTAENYEDAALLFLDAEVMFAIAGQETERRRNRALETIRRADEIIELSQEIAVEAERILEGGSR